MGIRTYFEAARNLIIDQMEFKSSNSLVDKCVGIGPEKQEPKSEDQRSRNKCKQMALEQFKENPDDSGSTKNTGWDLLIPPQE